MNDWVRAEAGALAGESASERLTAAEERIEKLTEAAAAAAAERGAMLEQLKRAAATAEDLHR